MRRLLAIGDLHLSHKFNREAFQALEPHEEDGLIICMCISSLLDPC